MPIDLPTIKANAAPYMAASGIPVSVLDVVLAALHDAGYQLEEASTGTPQTISKAISGEMVRIDGVPGAWLCGCDLGTNGWIAWIQHRNADGSISRGGYTKLNAGDSMVDKSPVPPVGP